MRTALINSELPKTLEKQVSPCINFLPQNLDFLQSRGIEFLHKLFV